MTSKEVRLGLVVRAAADAGAAGDAAGVSLKTSPQRDGLYLALRLAAFRLAAS
jgi:hypothetical protein